MKTPKRLAAMVEEGLVDEVVGQLMSGKEATVYIVRCGDVIRCAKVYKDAKQRSFRNNASYQEGRKVKNSRQARAMERAVATVARCRKKSGRAPRSMRSIGWRPLVFAFRSRICVSRACC